MKIVNIIGWGASGMMAAITAARAGAQVIVYEKGTGAGKKLSATGNGRCNFTNKNMDPAFFRGEDPSFVLGALSQFNENDAIEFFRELGIEPKDKNGYVYPRCMQARTFSSMLAFECIRLFMTFRVNKTVGRAVIEEALSKGEAVVIATGGMAAPKTGSDGSIFPVLREMGVKVIEPLPALVPLVSEDKFLRGLSGVRTECAVSFFVDDECVCRSEGELQFTDYGISGIVVFDGSRYIARGLHNSKKCHVLIDFLPETDRKELSELLKKSASDEKAENVRSMLPVLEIRDILSGRFNDKLCAAFLKHAATDREEVFDTDRLTDIIKSCRIDITGTKGFERAQVTSGGVDTAFVDPNTMEHKNIPGLYFAGEVLDVDAICGGYNLQWAWSSGYVAGKNAAK